MTSEARRAEAEALACQLKVGQTTDPPWGFEAPDNRQALSWDEGVSLIESFAARIRSAALLEAAEKARNAFVEWARAKGDIQLACDIGHSSLLGRLLEGLPILPTPPPRAYSYPWYELIETGRSEKNEVHGPYDEPDGRTVLIINQSNQWTVKRVNGARDYVVEYGGEEWRAHCPIDADRTGWTWTIERLPVGEARAEADSR